MAFPFFSLKYPTEKQVEIWHLKRNRLTGNQIAKKKGINAATVSKLLKEANERIMTLLENAARGDKIHLEKIDPQIGYAKGHNYTLDIDAYLTYSPLNGVQIWYDHVGECEKCQEYGQCRMSIFQEFKERGIEIPNQKLRPTNLIDFLFEKLEELFDG